jgi:hypothetical protein
MHVLKCKEQGAERQEGISSWLLLLPAMSTTNDNYAELEGRNKSRLPSIAKFQFMLSLMENGFEH